MTMRLDMDTATRPDIGTEAIGVSGVLVGDAEDTSIGFARAEELTRS